MLRSQPRCRRPANGGMEGPGLRGPAGACWGSPPLFSSPGRGPAHTRLGRGSGGSMGATHAVGDRLELLYSYLALPAHGSPIARDRTGAGAVACAAARSICGRVGFWQPDSPWAAAGGQTASQAHGSAPTAARACQTGDIRSASRAPKGTLPAKPPIPQLDGRAYVEDEARPLAWHDLHPTPYNALQRPRDAVPFAVMEHDAVPGVTHGGEVAKVFGGRRRPAIVGNP